jgi:hypothetical protein
VPEAYLDLGALRRDRHLAQIEPHHIVTLDRQLAGIRVRGPGREQQRAGTDQL